MTDMFAGVMKMNFLNARCFVLAGVMAIAASLHAGEPAAIKAGATSTTKKSAVAVEGKKAGEIIGMDLKGEGYSGEPKWESDKRLREARRLLKEVRLETGGGEEHKHLRVAIKEIDVALHD